MKKEHFTITDADVEKIKKIVEILPERQFINDFLNHLSANAEYPTEYNERVTDILELSKGIFSEFDNDNINSKYHLFTTELSRLHSFLLSHFFTDTSGYYEDHARLYPEWRYSTEDKEKKWLDKYTELHVLVSKTEKAYKDLLRTARSEQSEESTTTTYKPTNKPKDEEVLRVGPISYKNGILYHNNSAIENLAPQVINLGRLFLCNPNKYISHETIQNELTKGDYLAKENMQKLVSKLRCALRSKTKENLIKRSGNKGYIFNTKKTSVNIR